MSKKIAVSSLIKSINYVNTLSRMYKLNMKIEVTNNLDQTQNQLLNALKHPYLMRVRPIHPSNIK